MNRCKTAAIFDLAAHLGFFRVVVKAGSNGGISVRFYICTIGPQISNLKLKTIFVYNFLYNLDHKNSFVYWTSNQIKIRRKLYVVLAAN